MKFARILFLLILLCLAVFISQKYKATHYPFTRELNNSKGQTMPSLILSKQDSVIIIERVSDHSEYIVQVENLSQKDQKFLSKLSNDPNFSSLKKKAERRIKTRGRRASWTRMLENAKRQSREFDVPVLLAFLHSQDAASMKFDRQIMDSKKFRVWANGNVVLCRYYSDPEIRIRSSNLNHLNSGPSKREVYKNGKLQTTSEASGNLGLGSGLNGLEAREGRAMANKFGVVKAPVLLLLKPSGSVIQKIYPTPEMEPGVLLNRIYSTIYPSRVAAELTFLQKIERFFSELFD